MTHEVPDWVIYMIFFFYFTDRARDRKTDTIVALKKMRMEREKNGIILV